MGEICRLLENAGRIERFYVECQDCGGVVLDSARQNIPAGMPEHVEAMADTAIRSHAEQPEVLVVRGEKKEMYDCDSFEVVIEKAGEPRIDPTTDPDLDVDVTVQ
jgi:hypothetical protein